MLYGLPNSSRRSGIAAKHVLRLVSFCILIALASGQSAVCYICGYGFKVGNRDAVIIIDGQPNVPCGSLEDGGLNNRITAEACAMLPGIVFDICECVNDNLGSPTENPSARPVSAPVAPDTESPTSLPQDTPEPSQQATPEPSQQATSEPVAEPTSSPVPPPTSEPVAQPTSQPVAQPTSQPVAQPSSQPVDEPTSSPVAEPTTLEPVAQPTLQPVASPVPQPTPTPNIDPNPTTSPSMATSTDFPVQSPTQRPTASATNSTDGPVPSALPTNTFSTVSPSTTPSSSPTTKKPTRRPTVSKSPSSFPTPTPSGVLPTSSPFPTAGTNEPTDVEPPMTEAPSLTMQSYLIEVVMFMEGVTEKLDGGSEITFQTETARHIRNDFLPDLEDLTVGTNVKEQEILVPPSRRGRRLQATTTTVTVTTLKIVFDTAVAFRSPTDNLDVAALIGLAFDTAEDREAYIRRLQSVGGQPFTSITSINIEINGVPQNVQKEQAQVSDSGGVGLPVIIGASVGGAALVAIVIFAILRRRKPKTSYDDNFTFASSKKDLGHEHVNTNIIVEPQDDISTLGDPMPGVLMLQQDDVSTLGEPITDSALDRDDTISGSGVSGDYEYHKAYAQQGHQKSQDSLLQSLSSANGNGDDDGLSVEESLDLDEKRFEVAAPAGKLGMVIDTPNGGAPVVHAIKNTSSLANTGIQVGDRLVAIDGIDTTCLTAMQVSKLISQKANNPSRVLEFVRVRTGGPPQ